MIVVIEKFCKNINNLIIVLFLFKNRISYFLDTFSIPSIEVNFFNSLFKITLFFTSTLIKPENVPSFVSNEILFILTFIELDISEVILFINPILSIPLSSILALNS